MALSSSRECEDVGERDQLIIAAPSALVSKARRATEVSEPGRAHPAVKVRRATVGDLEQFAKNVQSVADEGKYIFTEEVTAEREKSMGKLFEEKDCLVIVAEVGVGAKRRVVGSLTLTRYGDVEKARHVRVLGMLVVRGYRGMGIGKRLMAHALEWSKAQGEVEKITLGVFSNNQRAFHLYERFGFEVEGVKKSQYYIAGKHVDEIEMALFLKRPSS
jgi:ribosomal protein S18 acetylase RimI-like enzyme